MSIKEIVKNGKKVGYDVQVSARHPITKEKKYLRRVAPNKWEANQLEQKLKNELQAILNGTQTPSWTELVSEYVQQKLNKKAGSTRKNELSIINLHLNPALERKEVGQIWKEDIEAIIEKAAERSNSTKHNIRKTAQNIFKFGIEKRYIRDNPCIHVKLPEVVREVPDLLSQKEVTLLLKYAKNEKSKWYHIWAFGVYSGLRSGELYALQYKHLQIEGERGVILVRQAWTKEDGYKQVKDKHYRTVPINRPLMQIINELREANPNSSNPEDYVLPKLKEWTRGDAARCLQFFLVGHRLPPIRFHDLRSLFITQLLRKGVAPAVVMEMTGHEDMETMMDYCRMVGSEVQNQTDVLDYSTADSDEEK
ncbi:site-specific integrase [bacterium]|nr:site-specific integrase [bacterium]